MKLVEHSHDADVTFQDLGNGRWKVTKNRQGLAGAEISEFEMAGMIRDLDKHMRVELRVCKLPVKEAPKRKKS